MRPSTATEAEPTVLSPERPAAAAGRRAYRICTRCVMDTSDPEITFDENGVCNHCHTYERRVAEATFRPPLGDQMLGAIVAQIKREGRRRPYDCILGLSGGVDSTYVAYLTKQLGLRPLALHLDNGWDSTSRRTYSTGRSSAACSSPSCAPPPPTRRSPRTTQSSPRSIRRLRSTRSAGSWTGPTSSPS
jgi:hypothetical protein